MFKTILQIAALVTVAFALLAGASQKTSTEDNKNKILNIAAGSGNYFILDMDSFNRSGLSDIINENIPEEKRAKFDEFIKETGVDPFQTLSLISAWGDFEKMDVNIAMVSGLSTNSINKVISYMAEHQDKEKNNKSNEKVKFALLGHFEAKTLAALTETHDPSYKTGISTDTMIQGTTEKMAITFMDQQAVLFTPSTDEADAFWRSISDASSTANDLLAPSDLFKFNLNPHKDGVENISGKLSITKEGLKLNASITASTDEKATEISAMIPMARMAFANIKDKELQKALSDFKFAVEKNTIHIALTIPEEFLNKESK